MRNAIFGGLPVDGWAWGGQFICVKFCNPRVKSKTNRVACNKDTPRETSRTTIDLSAVLAARK